MAHVFISYAREDRPLAEGLAKSLAAKGHTVWWDWNLVAGDRFRETIQNELSAADKVIVVWSPVSIRSAFVIDEASMARKSGKLIPVSVNGAAPPLGFGDLHTIDYDTTAKTIRRIAAALSEQGAPADAATPRSGRMKGVLARLLLAAAAVNILFGLYRMTPLPQTNLFSSLVSQERFQPLPYNYQAVPSFDCDKQAMLPQGHQHRTPFSDILCHDVRAADADKHMATIYRELRSQLPGDKAKSLLQDQRNWIGLRNSACAVTFQEFKLADGRLDYARITQVAHCLRQQTDQRAAELQKRLSLAH